MNFNHSMLGGFLGLVVWLRLMSRSIYRTRGGPTADRGDCLACGRCFAYCPQEQQKRRHKGFPPSFKFDETNRISEDSVSHEQ